MSNLIRINNKLMTKNNKLLTATSYVPPTPTQYSRYMWRFDGTGGSPPFGGFQMSRIKINDVTLPYTYITSGSNFSQWDNQGPSNMVDSLDNVGESSKWGGSASGSSSYGWLIFDLPSSVVPSTYSLMTAGDTSRYPNRNPTRIRLYASKGTPTTSDDSSWVLLDDRSNAVGTSNYTWYDFTLNNV